MQQLIIMHYIVMNECNPQHGIFRVYCEGVSKHILIGTDVEIHCGWIVNDLLKLWFHDNEYLKIEINPLHMHWTQSKLPYQLVTDIWWRCDSVWIVDSVYWIVIAIFLNCCSYSLSWIDFDGIMGNNFMTVLLIITIIYVHSNIVRILRIYVILKA